MGENLAILALFAFAYILLAGRLDRTPSNGPVVHGAFGVIAGPVGLRYHSARAPISSSGVIPPIRQRSPA